MIINRIDIIVITKLAVVGLRSSVVVEIEVEVLGVQASKLKWPIVGRQVSRVALIIKILIFLNLFACIRVHNFKAAASRRQASRSMAFKR